MKKIRINKKILIISSISSLLIIGGSIFGINYYLKKKNENNIKNPNPEPEITLPEEVDINNIFPTIETNYYYDEIEYENFDGVISEKNVTQIIKDVTSRIKIDFDKLGFFIEENNGKKLVISFLVEKDNNFYEKKYTFFINVL